LIRGLYLNYYFQKMRLVLTIFFCFFGLLISQAQIAKKNRAFPSVDIKTVDGRNFNTSEIQNDGKPIIVSFWATWCKPCVKELNTIADEYADWQDETGVKLVAISIDDARNMQKVAPFINGKGWEYEVYVDPNGDMKRLMNVLSVPHTFLLDADRQVVYSHNSYSPGDEQELYEKILEQTTK